MKLRRFLGEKQKYFFERMRNDNNQGEKSNRRRRVKGNEKQWKIQKQQSLFQKNERNDHWQKKTIIENSRIV